MIERVWKLLLPALPTQKKPHISMQGFKKVIRRRLELRTLPTLKSGCSTGEYKRSLGFLPTGRLAETPNLQFSQLFICN